MFTKEIRRIKRVKSSEVLKYLEGLLKKTQIEKIKKRYKYDSSMRVQKANRVLEDKSVRSLLLENESNNNTVDMHLISKSAIGIYVGEVTLDIHFYDDII